MLVMLHVGPTSAQNGPETVVKCKTTSFDQGAGPFWGRSRPGHARAHFGPLFAPSPNLDVARVRPKARWFGRFGQCIPGTLP